MKNIFFRLFIFLVISLIAGNTFANLPPIPYSHFNYSENKNKLFINWNKLDHRDGIEFTDGYLIKKIYRKDFPKTGVYDIYGNFLWAPSFDERVNNNEFAQYHLLNNGKYLIVEPYPVDTNGNYESFYQTVALKIYSSDKKVKTFFVKDFCTQEKYISFRKGIRPMPNVHVPGWSQNFKIDNLNNRIEFESCNIFYTIDLATTSVQKKILPLKLKDFYYEFFNVTALLFFIAPLFIIVNKKTYFFMFILPLNLFLLSHFFIKWNVYDKTAMEVFWKVTITLLILSIPFSILRFFMWLTKMGAAIEKRFITGLIIYCVSAFPFFLIAAKLFLERIPGFSY